MNCNNRMKSRLILLLCVLMLIGTAVNSTMAAAKAEPTGACFNATHEGVEYFIPMSALADKANYWRGDLMAEVVSRPDGTSAGEVTAMEIEAVNSTGRYQCTNDILENPGEFSCNSFPTNAQISGLYIRFKPSVSQDTKIAFLVYPTAEGDSATAKKDGLLLLEANATVKLPPYPCARNYQLPRDLVAPQGESLVFNTSKECSAEHKEVNFLEQDPPFAMVNIIPGDKLHEVRVNMEVTPTVDFKYKLLLKFEEALGVEHDVIYDYDPTRDPVVVIDASSLDDLLDTQLPLTLVSGKLYDVQATKKDLWGNDDFPTNVNFDIKFWYENFIDGTLGYQNSVFHFERRLNVQFAPYCTENAKKTVITGVASTVYDNCQSTGLVPYSASLVDEKSSPDGVIIPMTQSTCTGTLKASCTSVEAVTVVDTKAEPAKARTYRFITRKCADASCSSVTTTNAYVYSLTVSDGTHLSRTYRNNGNIYHSPGTRTEINMKAYCNYSGGTYRYFAVTGVRLAASEPGTYVVYGFVPESEYKKQVPTKYAVKFYVTINETKDLASCFTLANNGYFRAYWNDCLDYRMTQLMPFEHREGTEEAWIRNTSGQGVHFPYVPEWSYVPQQLEVASLTCKFEALSSAGRPADGYCRPNDVYVPPYTKVTITGGTLYLGSIPEFDEYRVAYARQDTYNISHLFFQIGVKACENVKKIPDTGVTMRTIGNFSEKVLDQTNYVFSGNKIRIPAIGLGMEWPIDIVHVYYQEGSDNLEWDLSTLGNYVGELEGGSYIPYGGNSVLTGHYSPFSKAMVFTNLEYVNLEDEIIIYGNDGIKYTYKVVEKFQTSPTDVYQMFQQVGERSITLVTCDKYNSGSDEYERRLLIRAVIDHQEPYEEGIW